MVARKAKKTAKRSTSKTKKTSKAARKTSKKASASKARKRTTPSEASTPTPGLRAQAFRNAATYPEDFHALYDRGFRSARGLALPAEPTITPQLRQMREAVQDLDVHYDQATQLPNLVITQRPTARLSSRAAGTPEGAVTEFIRNRGNLWRLSPDDANTIEVVSVSRPNSEPQAELAPMRSTRKGPRARSESTFNVGNLRTVNMVQRIEGKEVFNSEVTAAVTRDNEVLSVAGQFFPGAGTSAARSRAAATAAPTARTPEEEAIARAAFDLTNHPYTAADFKRTPDPPDSGAYRFYEYTGAESDPRPSLQRPVRLKDVMFPLSEGEFVPAYYMELWIKDFPAFSYVMDAVDTPDLLYRKNLTSQAAFKYFVHNTGDAIFRPHDGPAPGSPHPTGIPDGFQAPTVAERLISIESLLPGDPWLPPDATTTDGNNCTAFADLTAPDGFNPPADVIGKVTAPRTFKHKYNHNKSARDATNLQNSIVGMFFHVNWLHDRWYEAGFDEASGNAQKNNFGRGGVGGDPILAEGNHFSGTDNAEMATPADGSSPRMRMFEFLGPNPKPSRTSNHEALITFHEMGHYITNRLIGNGNGLTNQQGKAMGEGWGDFFAACMTSQATDNFAKGTFAVGGWTDLTPSFNNNYYFSIRRYPYSADMTKNPLTFKHIGNSVVLPVGPPISPSPAGNNEVHNAGEVWAMMLWEVFVNLVAKHGHADAEKRMLAYVIGGLKLTPSRPTFTQARDGIITAASALDAGDLPTIKAAFAKRGIGTGAVSPPSNSTSLAGVVESFVP
jgi:Fungalysin/Thermolysin Propeptide Motif./Fungalysin metallopeptidase (M36).